MCVGHFISLWILVMVLVLESWQLQTVVTTDSGCPKECTCAGTMVVCREVNTTFVQNANKLPLQLTELQIFCPQMVDSQNRPIELPNSLTSLPTGFFNRYSQLHTIYIFNCPIRRLQSGVFANLLNLRSMHLTSLLLQEIQNFAFSGSIKLETIFISKCLEFRSHVATNAFTNTNLNTLTISETSLDGSSFQNLISSSSKTLKYISWKMNKVAVALPVSTFSNFKLDDLSIVNCGLTDFHFLNSTYSSTILLSQNRLQNGILDFTKFPKNLMVTSLHLDDCNLVTIPSGLYQFPNLQGLYLSNNKISHLQTKKIMFNSQLSRLDLSNNRVQTFPQTLEVVFKDMLLNRPKSSIYLGNNPLHCNCEIKWILSNSALAANLVRNLICRTGQFLDRYLAIIRENELICTKPSPPLIQSELYDMNGILTKHSNGFEDGNLAVYLSANTSVQLTCSSKSDPAPTLRWIEYSRVIKQQSPDLLDKTEQKMEAKILVYQQQMDKARRIITCGASNYGFKVLVNTTIVIVNMDYRTTSMQPPIILPTTSGRNPTRSPDQQVEKTSKTTSQLSTNQQSTLVTAIVLATLLSSLADCVHGLL